ncbi:hypothetical protein M413DRAFT_109098 [Hebeloma cylindrosporum]|uniref:Uncharacterized protein n=1 Tax=Hebeloma cylindrosporum TaxID=76867 RepID=A0A0C2YI75_HEBCY|nr:hypothetical protein M413DRAFT_109098 [Hebeloma cylindrosporum h7]
MARLLLELIKFSTGAAVKIVYSAAGACLWSDNNKNDANNTLVGGRLYERGQTQRRVTPIDEYRRRSKLKAAQAAAQAAGARNEDQEKNEYVDVQRLLDTEMKEVFILNDIPVLIEIPNVIIGDVPEIVLRQSEPARVIPIIRTPRRGPVVEPEFSIYAHASSPLLNKAMYITPVRQAFLASGDIDLTLLRDASERVSQILQENRRRVDAGEDPSTVRKEARRRRAQEISTARQNIAGGLSVLEV